MSFHALQVWFEQIYYAFAKKPDELFWARLKEKTFAFVGKRLEQWDSRELLCVHRPKFLTVSDGLGFKSVREWIRCLYNNVIDRLFVATSQKLKDRRGRRCLSTAVKLLLSEFQKCTKRSDLHHITARLEMNNVRNLVLNVSPKFVLMTQVVLHDVFQQYHYQQVLLSCKSFHLSCQRLTS